MIQKMTIEELAIFVGFIVALLKGFDYLYAKFVKPKSDLEKTIENLKKSNIEMAKRLEFTDKQIENFEKEMGILNKRLDTVETKQGHSEKDRDLLRGFVSTLFTAVQALVNERLGVPNKEELQESAKNMENFLKEVALRK